jgi:hypothetical protein
MSAPQTRLTEIESGLQARDWLRFLLIPVLVCLATVAAARIAGGFEIAISAALAAIACLGGAAVAHVFNIFPRGDYLITSRLMLSSAARVVLPLTLLAVCKSFRPDLLERGMVYFVILFYLVGLLTDLATRMHRLAGPATVTDRAAGNGGRAGRE